MESRVGGWGCVALGVALTSGGCLPAGEVCPTAALWYVDSDGDGAGDPATGVLACAAVDGSVANGDDCDDADPDAYAGAAEVWYDGIDQDCDGGPDDDVDGDGFAGVDGGGSDCDDADPDVYPGAEEVWYDDVDGDCDGRADDDADRDGYGATIAGGTDCDDADDAVSPAAVEVCDDGVDNDCDGAIGSDCGLVGEQSLQDVGAALLGTEAGVAAGAVVAFAGDLDGDGLAALAIGSASADYIAVDGGVVWIVSSGAALVASLGDSTGRSYGRDTGEGFGGAVAAAGDLDEDGYGDLFVGASAASSSNGAAYLFEGPVEGNVASSSSDADFSGSTGARLGAAVAAAGDVNGDGRLDLVVGGPGASGAVGEVGRGWVFLGPVRDSESLSSALVSVEGITDGDQLGDTVAGVGDLDGDGADEVAFGAPGSALGADGGGAVAVFSSDVRGDVTALDGLGARYGDTDGARASVVAAGGDVNGDGYADLLVGARGYSEIVESAGAVYVWHGPVSGLTGASDADAVLTSSVAWDWFGHAVATAGDADGDGLADVLVGAPDIAFVEVDPSPAVLLFTAPFEGTVGAEAARASLLPGGDDVRTGRSVAGGGDVDGDGFPELLIGDPGDDVVGENAGAAWLLFGGGL